jgi:acyl carrier protein
MQGLIELEAIVRDVIGDDSIQLLGDTRPSDVAGWDSLNHALIMFALEHEYGYQFADGELAEISSMSELVRRLQI